MGIANSMNAGKDAGSMNPLQVLSVARSAGSALFAQATLHAQLAQIEWEEEKQRLSSILIFMLMGFACFVFIIFYWRVRINAQLGYAVSHPRIYSVNFLLLFSLAVGRN